LPKVKLLLLLSLLLRLLPLLDLFLAESDELQRVLLLLLLLRAAATLIKMKSGHTSRQLDQCE
jgi:hypothetical protein